jgi:hypothetical protein
MINAAPLRRLEVYAYQMAFYVLQNEDLAVEAAKTALLELGKNNEFYTMPDPVQNVMMKKTVISATIKVKQQML